MSGHLRSALLALVAAAAPSVASPQDRSSPPPPTPQFGNAADGLARIERQDFGVPPTRQLHAGAMHGPTPASIPGGQVITTQGLLALLQGRQVPYVLFDVLGGGETLPEAVPGAWMAQPGTYDDPLQKQSEQMLAQQTRGRKDVALIFYCLSRECWMSYNAALRAIHAGYTNVLWYRGGIEAWKQANLKTQPASPSYERAQSGRSAQPLPDQGRFTPVTPIAPTTAASRNDRRPSGELRITQGQFFAFAVPDGWSVGEEGQFAVTLIAPDKEALTTMVGNSGLPLSFSPGQFAYQKLSVLQVQELQLGPPRRAQPAAGFAEAVEFDVSYRARGIPCRGVAKVSMTRAYDAWVMVMTAAVAAADQWPGYAPWLPRVADQVTVTNGDAFGIRGLMRQNLQNSVALGQAAREYREWSQRTWQQVTDERNASQDRRNFAVRENLGGVQTFSSPFGTTPPQELPMAHRYYWTDRQGRVVGTNDPSADPNVGATGEWRRMDRVQR